MKKYIEEINPNDIAIVGLSCCFPKSENAEIFWKNLAAGRDCISTFTDDELKASGISSEIYNNPRYVRSSGIIDNIENFDAPFFDYSPREASFVDPQQRLFLEQAWKALEDSGYNPEIYRGRIGVYAGTGMNTYLYNNLQSHRNLMEEGGGYHIMVASDKDFLATRISYKLNLKGPSLTIQTACSTSLVAVHTACQAIRLGECDMALAGGVSLRIPQKSGYLYNEGIVLSPDGRCRAFDAKAQGTVIGNGAGIVVLKLLSEALDGNDQIYAIIKGSAINNDGSLKAGYTAPSLERQASVIYEAITLANLKPESISYIEAHGTGTAIGDPIEIAALTKAFNTGNVKPNSCAIGSVKTNIGHLDAAAGVAGLVKTVLSLKYQKIPASLNFETPNPKIDFKNSPFYVNTTTVDWKTKDSQGPAIGSPRRAGVSSFGIGGTNAHVILQEAPFTEKSKDSGNSKYYIINLSAKSETALVNKAREMSVYFSSDKASILPDASFTLAAGRKTFSHRLSFICKDAQEARNALSDITSPKIYRKIEEKTGRETVFLFPGQGSQYVNMGKELYESEPFFKETMDECFTIVTKFSGIDLKSFIYPESGDIEKAMEILNTALYSQPSIFIIEYSLAKLWISWGIIPIAMTGHSIGEYTAACLAGVMSLEDTIDLVLTMASLVNSLPEGDMLLVSLEEEKILPLLNGCLSLAAVNGQSLCAISGPKENTANLKTNLDGQGIFVRKISISHAFHSSMLDQILPAFLEKVKTIRFNKPTIPYVSTLTGDWMKGDDALNPEYWVNHLRNTVRFYDASGILLENSDWILLEIGPGRTLKTLLSQHPGISKDHTILNSMLQEKENISPVLHIKQTLSQLWLSGVTVDWDKYFKEESRCRVSLPAYPFDKKPCWIYPDLSQIKKTSSGYQDLSGQIYLPFFKKSMVPILKKNYRQGNTWLVLTDDSEISEKLIGNLSERGQDLIIIRRGSGYKKINGGQFIISTDNPEDYLTLFKEIQNREKPIDNILYLWGLQKSDEGISDFQNLLLLSSYTAGSKIKSEIRITSIFNNLFEINSNDRIDLNLQPVIGLMKTIPLLFPHLKCRLIDISPEDPAIEIKSEGLAETIISDIMIEEANKATAYRRNIRWVQDFEPVTLEEPFNHIGILKEKGTYLFLNSHNEIEISIARNLAQKYNAKIIMTQRPGYTIPENAAELKNITGIDFIEADLTILSDMEKVFKKAAEISGRVDGILYGTALLAEQTISSLNAFNIIDFNSLINNVKKEINNLNTAVSQNPPDFIAVNSAITGYTGSSNSPVHSSLYTWLDSFIREINKFSSTEWITLNWDNTGREIPQNAGKLFDRLMIRGIPPQVVISGSKPNEIILSDINLSINNSTAENSALSFGSRPDLKKEYTPARNDLEKTIINIWEETLGIKPIGIYDNFFELGGDSLMNARLISRLRKDFQVELPVNNVIFEDPTVSYMAEYIETILWSHKEKTSETPAGTKYVEGEF